MRQYLILDPKPSDITMIRVIKARTGQLQVWALVIARVKANLLLQTIKLRGYPKAILTKREWQHISWRR